MTALTRILPLALATFTLAGCGTAEPPAKMPAPGAATPPAYTAAYAGDVIRACASLTPRARAAEKTAKIFYGAPGRKACQKTIAPTSTSVRPAVQVLSYAAFSAKLQVSVAGKTSRVKALRIDGRWLLDDAVPVT